MAGLGLLGRVNISPHSRAFECSLASQPIDSLPSCLKRHSSSSSCSSHCSYAHLPPSKKTASSVSVSARNGWTQGPNVNVSQVAAIPAQAEVAVTWGMTVGQAALQGPREEMEDEVVVESDGPNGFVYAAIFDGHAGFSSAQFLRDELYKECVTALEGGSLLESSDLREAEAALTHAFLRADKRLLSLLEESIAGREKESGSTATVMLVRTDRLVMAHVGDSRAILSRAGKAEELSSDHRPHGNSKTSLAEVKRIQAAGGWVSHGRVCGSLSVSRAFGDVQFKSQKKEMLAEGIKGRRWTEAFISTKNLHGEWVVASPDTNQLFLDEDAEFILLASDGLWDSFKSADASQFVRKQLKEHGDSQRAAEAIAKAALMRNGQDNVSIIIIDFGRLYQPNGAAQNSLFGVSKWW